MANSCVFCKRDLSVQCLIRLFILLKMALWEEWLAMWNWRFLRRSNVPRGALLLTHEAAFFAGWGGEVKNLWTFSEAPRASTKWPCWFNASPSCYTYDPELTLDPWFTCFCNALHGLDVNDSPRVDWIGQSNSREHYVRKKYMRNYKIDFLGINWFLWSKLRKNIIFLC